MPSPSALQQHKPNKPRVQSPTPARPGKSAPSRSKPSGSCACGGGCPRCQAKSALKVGAPDNAHEREADAVADRVMRMAASGDPVTPQGRVSSAGASSAPASVEQVLRSPGQALDSGTRSWFEPRFGQDMSGIRVHTDRAAQQSARDIRANAYTVGSDIVFAAGQFAPSTHAGRHLLAHELTHVAQQGGNGVVARDQHGTPASVSGVTIDCGANRITFRSADGLFSYNMTECNVTPGEYEARVRTTPTEVHLNLGEDVAASVNFHFAYAIEPGQPNPSTLFGRQPHVHVSAPDPAAAAGGTVMELPIQFVAVPLDGAPMLNLSLPGGLGSLLNAPMATSAMGNPPMSAVDSGGGGGLPGYPMSVLGLGGHVLANGDFSWLGRGEAASRALSREYWSPFLPNQRFVTLDRLTNTLPRNLAPRIAAELERGGPLSWVAQRGFSEAELRSIPELVARIERQGVASLNAAELSMLQRAAALHIGGSSPGAPFASFSRAGATAPFLEGANAPRYRVRVEVPRTAALDVSGPNAFNAGEYNLTNIEEAEFLVVANREGRIVNVQRIAETGAEAGFLMRNAQAIRWGGRVLFVVGAAMSAHRIATASDADRPIVAAEEAGGQLGGMGGTALAVAGCLFFGVATGGVGLFICGLGGGIVGGLAGSAVAGGVARSIRDGGSAGGPVCPSCHAMQRDWDRARAFPGFSAGLGSSGSWPLDAAPLSTRRGLDGSVPLDPAAEAAIRRWLEESSGSGH